jgi:hypothetical protein
MKKAPRPWKKFARIERVEFQSGDIKFLTFNQSDDAKEVGEFESLLQAETFLNTWWADWWPKQVKSRRPA